MFLINRTPGKNIDFKSFLTRFLRNNLIYPAIFVFLLFNSFSSASNNASKPENGDIEFVFTKSETFSESVLKEVLLLSREKYFDRITFGEDRQRLKKFYFDNGFFDVLVDTSTSLHDGGESIDIKFKISENQRYTVKDIKYGGLNSISPEISREIYNNQLIRRGEPYVKQLVSQEKDRILNILQNNGYFRAGINDSSGIVIAKFSDELQKNGEYKNKVVITINFIGAVRQYSFGKTKISIKNNRYGLQKEIIERELEYNKGDMFNLSKKQESENNFSRLSIIQLSRLEVDTVFENEKTVQLKVDITLGKKYELTPGIAAYYITNKFYGGASIEYRDKNFFGAGRVFSVKLEGKLHSFTDNVAELSFIFNQPYLFNNNITLTYNPVFGLLNYNDSLEYIYWKNLGRISYYISPFTFYKNAYLDLTADFLRLRFTQDLKDTSGITIVPKNFTTRFMNSVLGITLVHNSTNDLFNPSSGGYHSITVESSGLLPRFFSLLVPSLYHSQYAKIYLPIRYYRDVSGIKTDIVALNFEIGDIIEYGAGEKIIPVDRLYKFFSGGGNSVRGWGAQKNGILDKKDDGGKFLLEGSMEYRWNPFNESSSFIKNIWIVGFWDYGNVWESDGKFRFDQIAMAAGIGIRYNTFVGPVRIDLGFKLYDPSEAEGKKWLWNKPGDIFKNKYSIHFGLGNAF